MSYFTQMAGLAVQNFVSAATGIAVAVALVRGLVRKQAETIGNFWADLTRCTLYVLLPLSSCSRWCSCSRAWRRLCDSYADGDDARRRASKSSRSDRPRRRSRSSSSARMAAASSA